MSTVTSRDNPHIKQVVRLIQSKDARAESGTFVCEGAVLLSEAQASGCKIVQLFCLPELLDTLPPLDCPITCVTPGVLQKISDVKTPQGIVFVAQMPSAPLPPRGPLIALEDVRDPGNVGTIIRTAEALGMAGVVLLGHCADPFSPKVVRSAMGALFRLPLCTMTPETLRAHADVHGLALYGTALRDDSVPIHTIALKNACVVIGNEAHGLSEHMRNLCQKCLIIPIETIQSLNAAIAAGICMWEMKR